MLLISVVKKMDLNEEVKGDNDVNNLNRCTLPSQDGYLTMKNLILRDKIHTGLDENIQVCFTKQIKSNQITIIFNIVFVLRSNH